MAVVAGKFLLQSALGAAVGYGTEQLLDMWFDPVQAVHSANARCTPDVCIPYPDIVTAEFCGKTVHSHRVHCSLTGREAVTRDQFAYVSWEKLLLDPTFKEFADSSPICKASFIDALCLDAFPHCHCDDRTACEIACRNMNLCLSGQGKNEIDCAKSCTTSTCSKDTSKLCKLATAPADHTISSGSVSSLVLAVVTMSLANHLRLGI